MVGNTRYYEFVPFQINSYFRILQIKNLDIIEN